MTVPEWGVVPTGGIRPPDDVFDWDGDGTAEAQPPAGSDVLPPIQPGDTGMVRLVDNKGDIVFFESSVRT